MPDDMIHAPDGRTWYETALAEAEKRGNLQEALEEICRGIEPRAGNGDSWAFGVAHRALQN